MKKVTPFNITMLLLAGIVLAAFTLSFQTVATLGNAYFAGHGWLFALLVDAGMMVLGLVRLQAGVIGSQGLKYGAWGGLFAALILSVLLNVVDAHGAFTEAWLHYVIHALPPVALLSLSELALTMYDKQLANIWPYIPPGYDWLAADSDDVVKFAWYYYISRPVCGNHGSWATRDGEDATSLHGIHLTIPDGLKWHDLIFERPK